MKKRLSLYCSLFVSALSVFADFLLLRACTLWFLSFAGSFVSPPVSFFFPFFLAGQLFFTLFTFIRPSVFCQCGLLKICFFIISRKQGRVLSFLVFWMFLQYFRRGIDFLFSVMQEYIQVSEVFVIEKATKTFSFVAFFFDSMVILRL